jgi:carbon monoxide dehydrogenase subunit G
MGFAVAADGTGTQIHYRADFDFSRLLNLVAPLVLRRKLDQVADETVEQLEKTLLDHA